MSPATFTTLALIGALGSLIAFACEGWVFRQLRGQQVRLADRIDALGPLLAAWQTASPATARDRAPAFDLMALDGSRVTRDSLVGSATPTLLTFTDPRCGPCYELLPDIGGWQRVYADRLSFVLVSAGSATTNRAMTAEYGIAAGSVLLQEEREVAGAFDVHMAPAAVLIGPDGRRAGTPTYGVPAIRSLVANTLGLAMPLAPEQATRPVRRGESAPALRRPDLTGNPIDLTAFGGTRTLLLFWSPGCHHCAELLPEMKAWGRSATGPRLLVVSRGPLALNVEAGLTAPVVLDDDRSLSASFGIHGTPAAVLIDEMGMVATEVARGERAVRAVAARWWAPASMGAR